MNILQRYIEEIVTIKNEYIDDLLYFIFWYKKLHYIKSVIRSNV